MATLHQRIILYKEQNPDQDIFSNRFTRHISQSIGNHFKKKNDPSLIMYIESVEDSQTFWVRDYPEQYTRTIDYIIAVAAREKLENIRKDAELKDFYAEKKKCSELENRKSNSATKVTPKVPTKVRKRVLIKPEPKKIWSVKPENPTLQNTGDGKTTN